MSIVLTLVRHGESEDNLQSIWAGHRDAPLSTLGNKQAEKLGEYFTPLPITAMYVSDLKRAYTTGRQIYDHNLNQKEIPFTVSRLLREQNFGSAEGESYVEGKYDSRKIPFFTSRVYRMEDDAESLDDLARRCDAALAFFLAPHLAASTASPTEALGDAKRLDTQTQLESVTTPHIIIVAHGLFISEMLYALRRNTPKGDTDPRYVEHINTAFSRLVVSTAGRPHAVPPETLEGLAYAVKTWGEASLQKPITELPTIAVTVVSQNQIPHLKDLEGAHSTAGSYAEEEEEILSESK